MLAVLEARGLVSFDAVEDFMYAWPFSDVLRVQEEIQAALEKESTETPESQQLDPFNFVASASMRGDGGCINWECRLKKNGLLARYTALYADATVVPLPIGMLYSKDDEFGLRQQLAGSILCVQQLRPLIDAGLIQFAQQEYVYCEKHLHQALPAYQQIAEVARELFKESADRFTVYVEPPQDGGEVPVFRVMGPTDFLEHGRIYHEPGGPPKWLRGWRELKKERKLSKTSIRKSPVVSRIFDDIARDVAIQQVLGMKYNARYLTNLPGEAMVLSRFSQEDAFFEECRNTLCAELTHSVPLLGDVPIRTVLKVRSEDPDAFKQYRAAITKIVDEYIRQRKTVGRKEAKEIYSDLLRPELLKLSSEARVIRRAAIKKAVAKTLIAGGVIGLGVFGGLLPAALSELAKAVGGIGLVRELGETLSAIERNPAQIRNSNMYFLLRLSQETEH